MDIKVDQVYSFKMNSGEEIIAKVKGVNLPTVTIINPVTVVGGANGGLGLVPSLFTAKQGTSITINTNSVALFGEVDENVQTKYIEATTGITIPDKKVLLG